VQVGRAITAKWFKPVAEILAAVYRLRRGGGVMGVARVLLSG
jgi:flagellar biosynthesis protein FlhB